MAQKKATSGATEIQLFFFRPYGTRFVFIRNPPLKRRAIFGCHFAADFESSHRRPAFHFYKAQRH
jgi:hypothetical protein